MRKVSRKGISFMLSIRFAFCRGDRKSGIWRTRSGAAGRVERDRGRDARVRNETEV